MTLQEVLNSDMSDSEKVVAIKKLQNGDNIEPEYDENGILLKGRGERTNRFGDSTKHGYLIDVEGMHSYYFESDDAILRQMFAESTFNPKAVSKSGAKGLLQLMPKTFKQMAEDLDLKDADPFDTKTNIQAAKQYLRYLADRPFIRDHEQDPMVRMAKIYGSYNGGAGNMLEELNRLKSEGYDIYYDIKWIDAIKNDEMRNYIKKVLGLDAEFNKQFEANKHKGTQYLKEGGNLSQKEEDVEMGRESEEVLENGGDISYDTKITIGSKSYMVAVAKTEEEKEVGLSAVESLDPQEGMLFVYDSPQKDMWFTMADTSIDLDIIFIDEDGVVTQVSSVKAFDDMPIVDKSREAQYVLEVNIDSGIKIGDVLEGEFDEDEKAGIKTSKMMILDENGNVQFLLNGGERIFSRICTKRLIKSALKAYKTDDDLDYRRVGRLILKELNAQDSR